MRLQTAILVQPYAKGKLTAKQLLPFTWDEKDEEPVHRTAAEQRARTAELMAIVENMEK